MYNVISTLRYCTPLWKVSWNTQDTTSILGPSRNSYGHNNIYNDNARVISDDAHDMEEMIKKLSQFKVSFTQYRKAFEMENVMM